MAEKKTAPKAKADAKAVKETAAESGKDTAKKPAAAKKATAAAKTAAAVAKTTAAAKTAAAKKATVAKTAAVVAKTTAATKTAAAAKTAAAKKATAAAKTAAATKPAAAKKATAATKIAAAKTAAAKAAAAADKTTAVKVEVKKTAAAKPTTAAKKTTAAAEATAAQATSAQATTAKATSTQPAAKKPAAKTTTTKTVAEKTTASKEKTAKAASTSKVATTEKASDASKAASAKTAETKKAATAKKTTAAKASAAKTTAAKKTTATKTTAEKKATAKTAAAAKAETKGAAAKKTAEKKAAEANEAASATKAADAKATKKVSSKKEEAPEKAAEEKAAAAQESIIEKAATKAEPEKKAEPVAAKAEAQAELAKASEAKAAAQDAPEPSKEVEAEPEQAKSTDEAVAEKEPEQVEEEPATLEFADVPGVLIAAAECAPLVKVGGLADVVGALPKYLKKLGVDARVIMPFHRQIKEKYGAQTQHMCDYQASLGWRSQYVGLERLELDGVIYYFIDNEFYFGGPIYCGEEFEGEQYAFFTRAVMDLIPQLDYDVKILHCNDWHTAMMPMLARTQYQGGMQQELRTALTIHNLHFQGQFSHEFDRDLLRVDDSLATPQFIEHYGCDNMLKAGIVFANKVNTVSPTYAREICDPVLGETLDGVLRSRGGDLWGILNGIDYEEWNPQTDPHICAHFSADDVSGKQKVRDALLEELGLQPVGENTAVISMVGRLTPQKGIDLVNWAIDELMNEDVRVIILGSGYSEFEDSLRDAENRHKGRLCSYIGYNSDLSHRIYAGSDLFLMPSLYEPCGISQMIAMRYGTLPIVRETGGLRDTVVPYNQYTGEGNGFSFANYDVGEMLNTIRFALWAWRGEPARARLVRQAMESDFSFDRCARAYAELYRAL